MAINNTVLQTTPSAIHTSVGPTAVVVIYLCNTSVNDQNVDVYAVPTGETAGTDNQIYRQLPIKPGDTYVIDMEKILLDSGDTIFATATTGSSITATVSYTGI